MGISDYLCLFMIYSAYGWVYESILAIVKDGKWDARGFLYGPVCPIYGVGAVSISLLARALPGEKPPAMWLLFVIGALGSIVLELFTSLLLEKLFHAVWWDYSEFPLNYQGRVCLYSALAFGVAAVFVVYILAPFTEGIVLGFNPLAKEIASYLLLAVFMADLTLTVSVLTNFQRVVSRMEDSFNERMGNLVEKAKGARSKIPVPPFGELQQMALRRVQAFRFPTISRERLSRLLNEWRRRKSDGDGGEDEHTGED